MSSSREETDFLLFDFTFSFILSRSAKVHAEEKLSVKTKKEKNTKLNTSKQNSSKKKTMNKYTNRLRSTKDFV
jgi:hypothetical protein